MNVGPTEARDFVRRFLERARPRDDRTIVFFPPAVSIEATAGAVMGRADIRVGAQNVWTEDSGAFTGEISAPMAKDAGASMVLVGHSERRHIFGETDQQTAKKCTAVARS